MSATYNSPAVFICNLSKKIMQNPVRIMTNRIVYDLAALEEYFQEHGVLDPATQEEISRDDIIPDFALKRRIEEFLTAQYQKEYETSQ